ncbi:hypothetical protein BX600DRAFT_553451 [Xylariales sp. PMI_506]|nr:hypothetical protein BX600DRAFT_553451 [Xylariales sp. PMI_506]
MNEDDAVPASAGATRQKSCNACVKAKRACDKRYPVCSRCTEKKVACIYAKRLHSEAFPADLGLDSIQLDGWADFDSPSPLGFLDTMSAGADIGSSGFTGLVSTNPSIGDTNDLFPGFTDTPAVDPANMQLIHGTTGQLAHVGESEEGEQALNTFNYDGMMDLCSNFEPWQVYDPTTKIHFVVQSVKQYPITYANDNQTPWMHRHLYKDHMAPSMRTCFSVSTLYSSMTDSNKTSVFRVLLQSIEELRHQAATATTPFEKLARAQALFMYQIIRLFDGDPSLKSHADKDMPLLVKWLDDLRKVRENLGMPSDLDETKLRSNPPSSWEHWVFAESVRRTILIAYCFVGLWNMICRDNEGDFTDAFQYINRWTMSRRLWEAPSSFEFYRTWRERPHHVVGNMDFKNVLKLARGDDADDFAKLLMVVYMGLDDTKQWFVDTGSAF